MIRAIARQPRTVAATRTVRVSNPTPTVTITSPNPGANVSGPNPVLYSLAPTNWNWYSVELLVDGSSSGSANAGRPLTFNPSAIGPGEHTLPFAPIRVRDVPVGRPHRTVPTPTVRSPARAPTPTYPARSLYLLAVSGDWNWNWVELWSTVRRGPRATRRALTFNPSVSVPGQHTLRFRPRHESGWTYQSATRTVNVPTPAVTTTGPSAKANCCPVRYPYLLSPTGWDWDWVELLVDGSSWASASPGDPSPSTRLSNPCRNPRRSRADQYGEDVQLAHCRGGRSTGHEPLIWASKEIKTRSLPAQASDSSSPRSEVYGAVVGVGSLSTSPGRGSAASRGSPRRRRRSTRPGRGAGHRGRTPATDGAGAPCRRP